MNYICGEYFAENASFVFDEGYLKFEGGVYVPKDQPKELFEHNKFVVYKNNNNNDYIFVNPHFLAEFLHFIEKNNIRCNLITHKSDSLICETFINRQGISINDVLNSKNIVHWYAQNCFIKHEKISYIPIGTECPRIGLHPILKKAKYLNKQRNINFLINFQESIPYNVFNERKLLANILKFKNIYNNTFNLFKREEFIKDLQNSYFCLSPTGAGVDCHRTWLALYCGAIPVLTKNYISSKIAEKFPVYLIDTWESLDFASLNKDLYLSIKNQKNIEINDLNLLNFTEIINIFK